jgi:peroxiredoxin
MRTLVAVGLAVFVAGGLLARDGVPESGATVQARDPVAPVVSALSVAPRVGHLAPDFVLTTLDGREVRLSDYRGHVVFLNFWATWCGPCKVEMPAMERLYREYRRQGFAILALSSDPEGAAVTGPFRDSLGLSFTIAHDPDAVVLRMYGVRALPHTFLVDRQGVITHQIFGARDWQEPEARDGIQKLLRIH